MPNSSALLLAGILLVALMSVARHWLPSVGLVLFSLLPVGFLPVPGFLTYCSPGWFVVLVWAGRCLLGPPILHTRDSAGRSRLITAGVLVLAAFVLLSTAHSLDLRSSRHWDTSFLVLACLFPIVARREPDAMVCLAKTWIWLGAALGGFAVIEYVLRTNPLYGQYFEGAPGGAAQVWSVYRTTTTLGHPLLNATFFSIAVALALDQFLAGGLRRHAVTCILSLASVVTSGSRSGLAAVAIGAAVVMILSLGFRVRRVRLTAVLLLAVVVGSLAGSLLFGSTLSRSKSAEASGSSQVRQEYRMAGLVAAARHPLWGYGPGASGVASQDVGGGHNGNFENGALEAAISLGLPGAIAFGGLLLIAASTAAAGSNPGVAGALASYSVSLGSFNLLEGYRPAHLLLGCLVGLAAGLPAESAGLRRMEARLQANHLLTDTSPVPGERSSVLRAPSTADVQEIAVHRGSG